MKKITFKGLRPIVVAGSAIVIATGSAAIAKNWSDWSTPVSIESLPGSSTALNTTVVDGWRRWGALSVARS